MANDTKINLKPRYGSNYSYKHSNLSLNDTNLSLIGNNSSSAIYAVSFTKKRACLKTIFSDVTPVITHFLVNFISMIVPSERAMKPAGYNSNTNKFSINRFTTDDNKRYYNLTTNCSAAKPSRHSLAIFMSKICLTNYQRFTTDINTNTSALQTSHKYSTDTIGTNICDGLSGPNKRPFLGNKPRRLNTVVNNLSSHFLASDNTLTNCSGAIRHG